MKYPLILLAAGKSSRMQSPKAEIPIERTPLLTYQWNRFEKSGGKRGWTVLAAGDAALASLVPSWVGKLENPDPDRGPFSSLQIGVRAALAAKCPGAYVLPLDVPAPPDEVWQSLESALTQGTLASIPCYENRGGHPVLLSREFLKKIDRAPVASRLDQMLHAASSLVARVDVRDSHILANWNTPADVTNVNY